MIRLQFPQNGIKSPLRPDKPHGSGETAPASTTSFHTGLLPGYRSPILPIREPTFEGFIQVFLPKNNPQVMDGTGVELHPEDDITSRAPELLVITLQLYGEGQRVKGQATGVLRTHSIN